MTSAEIRQGYLDFFAKKHAHTIVPSSPVVPHDDPTLLFTNAGMNQFKPIFLGQEKRAYTRAVDTQKCIRAGGKHNDLDDVGRSRRHHTFFEMLGNWSFGDYFKQGAIEMSWELLTKVWKIDPTRLHVSCFEGDEANGVPRDTESADIWKKVANWEQYGEKSEDHIHYFGKDNFWEMGDTGPCGPCTEIYIDRTPDKSGGPQVNGEDPRVMEIWNNVFIQYNRNTDRTLTPLPAQHVDTGMGFERICQVLQDVDSNYSIDLWHPFWDKLKALSGHTYSGKFPKTNSVDAAAEAADEGLRKDIAFRVIGDHIRCLTFALTDGAVPSNEGRGYVLRRILRRAVRFGRQSLGLKDPFLYQLVDIVVQSMGAAFPELKKNPGYVAELINDEEVSFGKTLDRGIALFEEAVATSRDRKGACSDDVVAANPTLPDGRGSWREISAIAAFKLHDTFGFPIDLTQIMAAERGMSVDLEGYETLMEEARAKARAGGKTGDDVIYDLPPDALAELEANGVPRTDDDAKYAVGEITATVKAIWRGDELVTETPPCVDVAIILDKTNFYAEMGGQVGDTGTLANESTTFDVFDTHDVGGYILHIGRCSDGSLKIGDTVTLSVSSQRAATQGNHTTTHLANWALREVLGEGVQQKGSL
ncbi:MAG: alanine--tRNA ligase, partial [Tepidisphaeraceae bacterium]